MEFVEQEEGQFAIIAGIRSVRELKGICFKVSEASQYRLMR